MKIQIDFTEEEILVLLDRGYGQCPNCFGLHKLLMVWLETRREISKNLFVRVVDFLYEENVKIIRKGLKNETEHKTSVTLLPKKNIYQPPPRRY